MDPSRIAPAHRIRAPGAGTANLRLVHVRRRDPSRPPILRWAFWLIVAAATLFCAFVLPFFFPPATPGYSPAYTAGADNRAAAISVALISGAVALVCWRLNFAHAAIDRQPNIAGPGPSRSVVLGGIGTMLAFTAILGFLVVRAGHFYSDSGYFLTQLRSAYVFHLHLFRQIEFPYGPILFRWPLAFLRTLVPLGLSMFAAYVVSLAAMEIAGLAMLSLILRALPLSRPMKNTAFLLIAFGCLDPLLGLNYTPFRFLAAAAAIVVLAAQPTRARALLPALVLAGLTAAVSPEAGFAFTAAAIAWSICQAVFFGWRWLTVGAAALAGSAFYILLMRGALETMGKFAAGSFNLILEPAPHLFILLLCIVVMAPLAVAWFVPRRRRPSPEETPAAFATRTRTAGLILALYVAALAMLPAAFGRCDPLHVFFNGLGIYLLAFVALDRCPRAWRFAGVAMIALSFLYTQAQDFVFYRGPLTRAFHRSPDPDDDIADAAPLHLAVGQAQVLFPWNAPLALANRLSVLGNYQPGFFCVMPLEPAAEQHKIDEMRQATYLMVPQDQPLVTENAITNLHGMRYLLRFKYNYKPRRTPYLSGALMSAELHRDWTPIQNIGVYTLYRRLH